MAIDRKTVDKIASLSRLGLSEDEKLRYAHDLNGILTWASKLSQIDTSKVEPMIAMLNPEVSQRPLRSDIIEETPGADQILSNAPARKLDFFTVPKVVE